MLACSARRRCRAADGGAGWGAAGFGAGRVLQYAYQEYDAHFYRPGVLPQARELAGVAPECRRAAISLLPAGVGLGRLGPASAAGPLAGEYADTRSSGRDDAYFFLVFFVAVNDISDMFSCASRKLYAWQAAEK